MNCYLFIFNYITDKEKYTYSETRQKFLWLEMEEPIKDPNDNYYVRVIADAPDPILCLVRSIIPGMDNDFAGMGAMQEMISLSNMQYFAAKIQTFSHDDRGK